MARAAGDLPSRSSREAYDYVLAENSVEYYQEFVRIYPHDPMADRIRILLGNLLQARAWYTAVQTNSPVAYKSFYEKFSNGPYAQSALKMAAQPKIIPLSQPSQILAAPTVKAGGLGIAKGHLGNSSGMQGQPQVGGKIVTLPSPGTKPASGKLDVDAGKIVTLPPPGAKPASTNAGADTGKIVSLPVSKVGKMGERPVLKLEAKPTRVEKLTDAEKRTSKSAPLVGVHRGPAAARGIGTNQRFATSAPFRGSTSQARTGGFKMMR
jgi:hypothetical protein